jgi:type II secretory pathway pseudopilin PulG
MKRISRQRQTAFTRIELIAVILVLLVVGTILMPMDMFYGSKRKAQRIACVNNLKSIGGSYRTWADDHGGQTPASESVRRGGWSDLLTNVDQGAICWTNYSILADALGRSPKLVMCPSDDRFAAEEFATNAMPDDLHAHYFQSNSNLSYFVGVSASSKTPRSLLAGDRNLGPGIVPDPEYGFSPAGGKGNDVAIPISGPLSWSLKIHSCGEKAGAGNILLGDGSVQQVSSASFNQNWLRNAAPTTNWPASHIPATPSIRLVFP